MSPAAVPRTTPLRLAVLFALATLLSGFTLLRGIAPHDEGLILQAASRLASGQWPYRDFWTNYPPGQPLLLAGLQDLFGPSLLIWRVLRMLTDAGVSVCAYLLTRRRASEPLSLLVWLAAAGAMAFPTGPNPNPLALLLALGALLSAERWPAGAGAMAGLACLFRFELGGASILAALLLARPGTRWRLGVVAVGVALITLAPFLMAAPGAMLDDTVGFYGIQSLQRLPFPLGYPGALRPNKLLEFYLPLILVAGSALWAAALVSRLRRLHAADFALVPVMLVSLGYLLGRTDEFHLIPLAVVLPVALAWAAASATRWLALLCAGVVALVALHGLDRRSEALLHPGGYGEVPGAAADGVQTTAEDAQSLRALRATIEHLTHPGEAIFVANPRHDLVQAGDPLLYVILARANATRYDVMQPGLVTTASVQREIIHSLQRRHVRVVVRWLDARATPPATLIRPSGVHLLDRFLAQNFRPYARYGVYQVLVRG